MNINLYVIEDYKNETAFRPQQNKPNSKPISTTPKGVKPCAIIISRKSKKQSICVLKKSAKRFDFGGLLGYNSSNKVPVGPEEVIWKIVIKGAFSVKLKFLTN